MTATCYHGHRTEAGTEIIAHDTIAGQRWPLRHVVRHSPTGMEWGYGGSGPADLSRSLLIDALGDGAVCPTCRGSRRLAWPLDAEREVPFDAALHREDEAMGCLCTDGFRQLPYHDFKFAVVGGWGDHWQITRAEILTWLMAAGCDVPQWIGLDRPTRDALDRLVRDAADLGQGGAR